MWSEKELQIRKGSWPSLGQHCTNLRDPSKLFVSPTLQDKTPNSFQNVKQRSHLVVQILNKIPLILIFLACVAQAGAVWGLRLVAGPGLARPQFKAGGVQIPH